MLKPTKYELYLIYTCKCGIEWGKTPKEVKRLGGMVCSSCGAFTRFAPIERVKVCPVYKTAKKHLTKTQQDAIMALRERRFPKKEAEAFVMSHKFQTVDDYVLAAVRKGTL